MATLTASGINFSDGSFCNSTNFNGLGSYAMVVMNNPTATNMSISAGSNYSVGTAKNQLQGASYYLNGQISQQQRSSNISGTWRWLGPTGTYGNIGCCVYLQPIAVAVRVA